VSLIDDALRRAQSARGGAASPSGPPDPWTTGPLPDPGRGRGRRLVLAAVIAVCAAGGLAAWLRMKRPAAVRETPPAAPLAEKETARAPSAPPLAASFEARITPTPPSPVRAAAAAPVPPPVRTEAASAIARGAAPGRERLVFSGTPTPAPRPPRPPVGAVAAAPVPAMRSASAPPEIGWSPPPARPEREHAPPPPRPSPERRDVARGEIAVPGGKIELGGIVYSETNPVAVLNGHVVGVGAYVEGFLVVAIDENRVELKNDQRTIVLTLR